MGDEVKSGLQFQQAGQSANPSKMPAAATASGATPGEGTEQEQTTFTRAEVLQMVKDVLKEELPRLSQSMSDKTAAKVAREVSRLQRAGISVTPEQVATLVKDEEADASPTANTSKQTPAPVQSDGEKEQPNPVVLVGLGLISKAGLDVERDFSEEEKAYFAEAEDEVEFITRIKQTIAEKQERRGSPSRVPGNMSGSNAKPGSQAAILQELNTLLKNPMGNAARIRELKGQIK